MAESHPQSLLDALRPRLAGVAELDADALEAEQIAVLGRKSGALDRAAPFADHAATRGAPRRGCRRQRTAPGSSRRRSRLGSAPARRRRVRRRRGCSTSPCRVARRWVGAEHPVTQVVEEICEIFRGLGFNRAIGPEAETEWMNFGALNFPPDHPAMDMHDTFYLDVGGDARPGDGKAVLLRTHTSPVQIRTMLAGPPPYRVVIPGVVYRKDPFDPSHAPVFCAGRGARGGRGHLLRGPEGHPAAFRAAVLLAEHQGALPALLLPVHRAVRRDGRVVLPLRWRRLLRLQGHRLDGNPRLRHGASEGARDCGVDAERYTGFAFGMGPQRIAMQRYGIPDIRLLYEGDMRFLGQMAACQVNISRRWLEAFLRRPLESADVARRLAALGATVDAIEELHRGSGAGRRRDWCWRCGRTRTPTGCASARWTTVAVRRATWSAARPTSRPGRSTPSPRSGSTLPGGLKLEKRKIRGETSEGMLCSARELGLGQEHDGILELTTDAAPGTPFLDVARRGGRTPGGGCHAEPSRPARPQGRGPGTRLLVRRHLPPSAGARLRRRPPCRRPSAAAHGGRHRWRPCRHRGRRGVPRFLAAVMRGVRVGASPEWLRARVEVDRHAVHQQRRRRHQLRHVRAQPANARLRRVAAQGPRGRRAAGPGRRDA